MDKQLVAKVLLTLFAARNDVYSVATYDGNNVSYRPVNAALTENLLVDHLEGNICLGAYQLSPNSEVTWVGWDVDDESIAAAQAQTLMLLHQLKDLPRIIEFSGSKGYHIIMPLTEAMPASEAKAMVEAVRQQAGLAKSGSSHCEAFPKQAELTPTQPFGNLLKIPLGIHPRTHKRSVFVDPANGWESGLPLDPLEVLATRITPSQLASLVNVKTPEDTIVELMIPRWVTGDRHQLALILSGYLLTAGWGMDNVSSIIRKVCEGAGDSEVGNRLQAVTDTFKAAAEGRPILGYQGLADIMPGPVLRQLMVAASTAQASPEVQMLDQIRFAKLAPVVKVRQAVEMILRSTSETGRWLRSGSVPETPYFLDRKSHQLYEVPANDQTLMPFFVYLRRTFGLNVSEAFGAAVYSDLRLMIGIEGQKVEICRGHVWDEQQQKLYINLGGPEVYILDGSGVELGYNGECGKIFASRMDYATIDITEPVQPIAWKLLIDDLSLTCTDQAPATPAQQKALLKAWILGTFFPQLHPTKALLMFLGAPGSGKTTAARRIIRVLEGMDQDVLGIATDKEDSLRVSLMSHNVLALDNLEKSGVRWLADVLNRVSTGSSIELRKLYTTNSSEMIKPNCFVAMTAVSLPFSDETVLDRSLPIEFTRIDSVRSEAEIRTELRDQYNVIWRHLLSDLNQIVRTLRSLDLRKLQAHERMADFDKFCQVVALVWPEQSNNLLSGLRILGIQQSSALADSSPFITALDVWVTGYAEDAAKPHTLTELNNELRNVARGYGDNKWRWAKANNLKPHMVGLWKILVERFGMVETTEGTAHPKKLYTFKAYSEETENGL